MDKENIIRAKRFLKSKFGPDRLNGNGLARLLAEYKIWLEPNESDMPAIKQYIKDYELGCKSRLREFVYPRNYLYNYIKQVHKLSYSKIGSMFNGKDHASVMHGIRNHKNWTETKDPVYAEYIEGVKKIFKI